MINLPPQFDNLYTVNNNNEKKIKLYIPESEHKLFP